MEEEEHMAPWFKNVVFVQLYKSDKTEKDERG